MILLWILCLTLRLTTLNAKVVPDLGFYDVLVKHCPMLNMTNPPFKNQEVFQKCKSWHKINETKTLTDETKNNVLCLLYYDSLASLCTEMNTSKISNITINLVPDLKDYKIDKVCKKPALFPASRKLEHGLVKIINDEGICYKLCLNFDGSLVNECGLAYYFVNYNISQSITPSVVPSAQLEETNPNVIKSHSADKAPESASVDAPKPQQQATDVENKSEKTNQAPSTKDKPVIPQNNVSDREILSSNVVSANKNPPKQVPDVNTNKQSVAAVADEKISNSDVPKPASNEGTPVKDQPQSVEPQTKKDAPQEHSQVQPASAETASEQNQQEPIPMVEQEQGGDNKGDTGLEDQQNALNREGQMMDDDEGLEDEESNGGKCKCFR